MVGDHAQNLGCKARRLGLFAVEEFRHREIAERLLRRRSVTRGAREVEPSLRGIAILEKSNSHQGKKVGGAGVEGFGDAKVPRRLNRVAVEEIVSDAESVGGAEVVWALRDGALELGAKRLPRGGIAQGCLQADRIAARDAAAVAAKDARLAGPIAKAMARKAPPRELSSEYTFTAKGKL